MVLRDANGLTEQEFLAQYNPGDYPRPSVAADIVIFTVGVTPGESYRKLPEKELRVLLIRRGGHPFLGSWALPGGFVRPGETVGEAARRELREETGVGSFYLEQLRTFSQPGRDPRTWVMSCAHMALVDSSDMVLQAGDDASDARWFQLAAPPEDDGALCLSLREGESVLAAEVEDVAGEPVARSNRGLAFDHAQIVACALHRLRSRVESSDAALSLMPARFTLTELQQVYEAILGKQLLKAAFRRKIAGLVEPTGSYTENAGHRPSQLFHRKEKGSAT